MEDFSTKNLTVHFYGLPKDEDRSSAKASSLKWVLDWDFRDWGVKDINLRVPDQDIEVSYELYNEEKDEYEDKTETISLKDVEIEHEELKFNSAICPREIEIDFKRKTATVRF